jgi:hypothetical protein
MTAFVALLGMKGVGEDLEGVMRMAKHPVDNFGRLAKFARGQWDDVMIGHRFEGLHPQLRAEGEEVGRLTKRLAKSILRVLGTHREKILDMELIHQRVAGAVIEIYAMAAVISKLQSTLESSNGKYNGNGNGNGHHNGKGNGNGNGNGHHHNGEDGVKRDLVVGKSFCHHAAKRVDRFLTDLFDNHDPETIKVADVVLGEL